MQSDNQIRNKNIYLRRGIKHKSPKTSEQYSWWCAGLCLQATEKPFLFCSSDSHLPDEMLFAIALGGAEHKITSFPNLSL
jgi:hypothetical protein